MDVQAIASNLHTQRLQRQHEPVALTSSWLRAPGSCQGEASCDGLGSSWLDRACRETSDRKPSQACVRRSPRLGHLACLRSPGIITRVRDSTLGKRWGKGTLASCVGRATPAPATFQERGGGDRLQITGQRMEIGALISLPLGLREISRLNAGRPARTPARIVAGLLFQTQGGQLARKACKNFTGGSSSSSIPIYTFPPKKPHKKPTQLRGSAWHGEGPSVAPLLV